MTPDELRAAMERLGMSTTQLAVALRLGKGGDSTVRKWLRADRTIPGPVETAVELLLETYGATVMKQVVAGRLYDTDSATLIGSAGNDFPKWQRGLWITAKGSYFLAERFYHLIGKPTETIAPLSADAALHWAARHLDTETVTRAFQIEEA